MCKDYELPTPASPSTSSKHSHHAFQRLSELINDSVVSDVVFGLEFLHLAVTSVDVYDMFFIGESPSLLVCNIYTPFCWSLFNASDFPDVISLLEGIMDVSEYRRVYFEVRKQTGLRFSHVIFVQIPQGLKTGSTVWGPKKNSTASRAVLASLLFFAVVVKLFPELM